MVSSAIAAPCIRPASRSSVACPVCGHRVVSLAGQPVAEPVRRGQTLPSMTSSPTRPAGRRAGPGRPRSAATPAGRRSGPARPTAGAPAARSSGAGAVTSATTARGGRRPAGPALRPSAPGCGRAGCHRLLQQPPARRVGPVADQPVEQFDPALDRSALVAPGPPQRGLAGDDPAEAEQLVLDVVERAARSAAPRAASTGEHLDGIGQVARGRPARPRPAAAAAPAAARRAAAEHPVDQAGAGVRLGRRVGQRPPQPALPVQQPVTAAASPAPSRRRGRSSPATRVGRPASRAGRARSPGRRLRPPSTSPAMRGRPRAARRRPAAAPPVPASGRSTGASAIVGRPGSGRWSAAGPASSASDSPTTRSARPVASVPISPRSSRTTCCRCAVSCSSPRATMRADSSCAAGPHLLDDRWPSARASSRIRAASVRASASCWRYSLEQPLRLGLRPPRPARCRPRSRRGGPGRSPPCAARRTWPARRRRCRRR